MFIDFSLSNSIIEEAIEMHGAVFYGTTTINRVNLSGSLDLYKATFNGDLYVEDLQIRDGRFSINEVKIPSNGYCRIGLVVLDASSVLRANNMRVDGVFEFRFEAQQVDGEVRAAAGTLGGVGELRIAPIDQSNMTVTAQPLNFRGWAIEPVGQVTLLGWLTESQCVWWDPIQA